MRRRVDPCGLIIKPGCGVELALTGSTGLPRCGLIEISASITKIAETGTGYIDVASGIVLVQSRG